MRGWDTKEEPAPGPLIELFGERARGIAVLKQVQVCV